MKYWTRPSKSMMSPLATDLNQQYLFYHAHFGRRTMVQNIMDSTNFYIKDIIDIISCYTHELKDSIKLVKEKTTSHMKNITKLALTLDSSNTISIPRNCKHISASKQANTIDPEKKIKLNISNPVLNLKKYATNQQNRTKARTITNKCKNLKIKRKNNNIYI